MKNSTKFVWIVLGAIAVLLIVLTVMVRSIISDHIVVNNSDSDNASHSFTIGSRYGEKISKEYNLDDFDRLRIVGGWDILVIADDEFRITVETDENAFEQLAVENTGGALYLGLDYKKKGNLSEFHGASATIYMPVLDAVDVDGAVNLNVENFSGEAISLSLDGAGQIIGENCTYGSLKLVSNGAVNIDFSKSGIKNADVNTDGAGNIVLNMTGGELTGKLAGLSNLEYSGEVSRLDVDKDGIGGITKKN